MTSYRSHIKYRQSRVLSLHLCFAPRILAGVGRKQVRSGSSC